MDDFEMYEELREQLRTFKNDLLGDWILKNSSYDTEICDILKMNFMKSRYWDAEWNGLFIEFKKGRSIWLDLVRYSEVLLQLNNDASRETITLFFVPTKSKDKIEEIVGVETKSIIEKLGLTDKLARSLVELNDYVPRQLNAQASLTVNDVKKISRWIV
jgi:hypothetical protein